MSWRIFCGDWDENPEREHFNLVLPSWAEARQRMLDSLSKFNDDECAPCRVAALDAQASLTLAGPGLWVGNVEGEDYVIAPADLAVGEV